MNYKTHKKTGTYFTDLHNRAKFATTEVCQVKESISLLCPVIDVLKHQKTVKVIFQARTNLSCISFYSYIHYLKIRTYYIRISIRLNCAITDLPSFFW